jgi:hypothetical protein
MAKIVHRPIVATWRPSSLSLLPHYHHLHYHLHYPHYLLLHGHLHPLNTHRLPPRYDTQLEPLLFQLYVSSSTLLPQLLPGFVRVFWVGGRRACARMCFEVGVRCPVKTLGQRLFPQLEEAAGTHSHCRMIRVDTAWDSKLPSWCLFIARIWGFVCASIDS